MSRRPDSEIVGEHYLYRLFDKAGELLYIGVTGDLASRLSQHRSGFHNANAASWRLFEFIDSHTAEVHPNRTAAKAAERAAIAAECPPFNTHHNPRRYEGLSARYIERADANREPTDFAAQINALFTH